MVKNKWISIEVAYATPDAQKIIAIEVPEQTTIEEAITISRIVTFFPEINLTSQNVGIFSQRRNLSDQVKEGDRIEIYRPLLIDPKEARRHKAKKNKKP